VLEAEQDVRVVLVRGAGGQAFGGGDDVHAWEVVGDVLNDRALIDGQ